MLDWCVIVRIVVCGASQMHRTRDAQNTTAQRAIPNS
jgi:hypothetical protein